jgi:hypothetical protein
MLRFLAVPLKNVKAAASWRRCLTGPSAIRRQGAPIAVRAEAMTAGMKVSYCPLNDERNGDI